MIIQLQPGQISLFWSSIKYAITKASGVNYADREQLLNNALMSLLEGSFQCWLGFEFDEQGERKIHIIAITSIVQDKLFRYNNFHIDYIYAYRQMTDDILLDGFEKLKEFAVRSQCKAIIAESMVPRVGELAGQFTDKIVQKYIIDI